MTLADSIREHVAVRILELARRRGEARISVRAGDVHAAMGLRNRMPAVYSALDAQKFLVEQRLRLVDRSGPKHGATTTWIWGLR